MPAPSGMSQFQVGSVPGRIVERTWADWADPFATYTENWSTGTVSKRWRPHVEVPAGEASAVGSPDAAGPHSADWHATPRAIVDEWRGDVLSGALGTVVRKADRPSPCERRRTHQRSLLLDTGDDH